MAKCILKQSLHSDKYENRVTFSEQLGIDVGDDILNKVAYALYEVEFLIEFDTETGDYRVLSDQEAKEIRNGKG